MATLTWRDVAGGGSGGGGGRYNQGNSDQLMEGIRGFNEALDAIVNRKNNRALHDIENQLALNNLAAEHQQSQSAAMQDVITAQDEALDTAAEAEWNRASGSLLDSAFRAGANPALPDPLRSDAYRKLSPRAQALGSALIADQIISGREFASEDDARRATARVADENLAISQAREEREAEAARLAQEAARDPLEGMDKASRERLRALQTRAASDYATYSGAVFADDNITNNKNIDPAKMYNTWYKVGDRLREEGYGDTPIGVLKRFVAEVGKDSGSGVEEALYKMAQAYHRANLLNSFVTEELATARGNPKGYQVTDERIQEIIRKAQGIKPEEERVPAPAPAPVLEPPKAPMRFHPKHSPVRW